MTPMQRATEAGAMNDAAFDGREWMSMSRADRQRYLDRALSTVKTTLPILAEELAAAVGNDPQYPLHAIRARVQSMMEEG
jgi:hypothetical protein